MTRRVSGSFAAIAAVIVATVACSGTSDSGTPATVVQTVTSAEGLNIRYQSRPDPPETGSNAIEVIVTDRNGAPVTDATVTAVFSMPAMPAMNMPAMRSDAPLNHAGNGTYRGTGQLSMGGTWNVNVTVSRGTETLGTSRFSIVAK
jgi:Cu(I)/Ag(I) efflux system membrane fusion protein/cobalt-zinc-cadmium efflux system membrane fusion protein